MEGFKEFLGKTLDAAITEACTYYNASREKLEIEIIQDAKSGIFGIVGARKAKVRARRAALREVVENALGRVCRQGENRGEGPAPEARKEERRNGEQRAARRPQTAAGDKLVREEGDAPLRGGAREEAPANREADEPRCREERGARQARKAITARTDALLPARQDTLEEAGAAPAEAAPAARAPRGGGRSRSERPRPEERGQTRELPRDDDLDEAEEGLPRRAVEELDQERLAELARECVGRLVRPMVDGMDGEPEVGIVDGRVRVAVDCGEDSGLLIGREGQTLAALQYLASRIVSRGMNAAVRVQLDAGRYRQRQEEKLRDMALALAAKVRQTGRSYSTRPLSSYHRRIIHVCLQDLEDILTRSSGDGPLKRVVIMRRRPEKGERPAPPERTGARRAAPSRTAPDREPAPDMTPPDGEHGRESLLPPQTAPGAPLADGVAPEAAETAGDAAAATPRPQSPQEQGDA